MGLISSSIIALTSKMIKQDYSGKYQHITMFKM